MREKYIVYTILIIGTLLMLRSCGSKEKGVDAHAKGDLLASFEEVAPWDTSPDKGFPLERSREHVTQGKYSLKAVYPQGGLPSINTRKLRHDWGEYEFLAFDVFNPQNETLNFVVRLDDESNRRTNIPYKLRNGLNKIRIPRAQIAGAIDAAKVAFVVLFLNEPGKSYELYFDNMRLERSGLRAGLEDAKPSDAAMPPKDTGPPLPVRKAVIVPEPPVSTEGELKVPVARLKDVPDSIPLISAGVPFAPGQLKSEKNLAFFDQEGNEIPIAAKVLARWHRDQSIRSVLVQFKFPIEHIYQYVLMKWGVPRQTRDLAIVEPSWDFPEGFILLPAEWLCASEVIGEQMPLGQKMFIRYDANIEKNFANIRDKGWTGDVGQDNFYSTAHVFYQFYVRSGELKYFLAARKELLHYRENQVIHQGEERGNTSAGKPFYIYVEAMADDYYLTGDPRSLQVAEAMAEYLKKSFEPKRAFYPKDGNYFWNERVWAFPLLGTITYYEMSGDRKYLKAAGEYMENLYRTQLEWPSRGGFIHNLYAHDPDEGAEPDEWGGSPFMTGLLLEGVIEYHRVTGSDTAADSIFRALDWILKEGLTSGGDSFKYLTARKFANSGGESDLNLLVAHAFGYGYKISGYERGDYLLTGKKVFERGMNEAYLDKRKHFNQNFRSSAHFLGYIKDAPREALLAPETARVVSPVTPSNILYFEDFNFSLGKFRGASDTSLEIDNSNPYLNGSAMFVKSNFVMSNLSAGIVLDEWNIEEYPVIQFAYFIPKGAPVGMRVKTEFGDWVCIGGAPAAQCGPISAKIFYPLADDGRWHEIHISTLESVRSLVPGVKRLKEFQFFTNGNAQKEDSFWLDDFKLMR